MIACALLSQSHHQRYSTMKVYQEFRQSAMSRQVRSWIFDRELPVIFFARQSVSNICTAIFHSAFAIKIRLEFQKLELLSMRNLAQKRKKVLVEMGILGDFIFGVLCSSCDFVITFRGHAKLRCKRNELSPLR